MDSLTHFLRRLTTRLNMRCVLWWRHRAWMTARLRTHHSLGAARTCSFVAFRSPPINALRTILLPPCFGHLLYAGWHAQRVAAAGSMRRDDWRLQISPVTAYLAIQFFHGMPSHAGATCLPILRTFGLKTHCVACIAEGLDLHPLLPHRVHTHALYAAHFPRCAHTRARTTFTRWAAPT